MQDNRTTAQPAYMMYESLFFVLFSSRSCSGPCSRRGPRGLPVQAPIRRKWRASARIESSRTGLVMKGSPVRVRASALEELLIRVAATSPERERVAGYARRHFERKHVPLRTRQIDQSVQPLAADRRHAAAHVATSQPVAHRLAVEQQTNVARPASARAEHQEDPLRAEGDVQARSAHRGRRPRRYPPRALERQAVVDQPRWRQLEHTRPRGYRPIDETLGARRSEIALRGGHERRWSLASSMYGRPGTPARIREQLTDGSLRLPVVTLAEVRVTHPAARVDQVLRRPVLVRVGVPGGVVVVLDDRVAQAVLVDRIGHVVGISLERELGRVHADDRQPLVAVALVPGLDVGERADAVDAGVGPEVDEH